ncbi:MAG: hypothetical protein RIE86_26985 [Imperialibacter sp.]|uniref:hypothetical protein n=1 Tax=Imperialibacter sp. TaxID=2038411 RepID=UPI0032EE5B2D
MGLDRCLSSLTDVSSRWDGLARIEDVTGVLSRWDLAGAIAVLPMCRPDGTYCDNSKCHRRELSKQPRSGTVDGAATYFSVP